MGSLIPWLAACPYVAFWETNLGKRLLLPYFTNFVRTLTWRRGICLHIFTVWDVIMWLLAAVKLHCWLDKSDKCLGYGVAVKPLSPLSDLLLFQECRLIHEWAHAIQMHVLIYIKIKRNTQNISLMINHLTCIQMYVHTQIYTSPNQDAMLVSHGTSFIIRLLKERYMAEYTNPNGNFFFYAVFSSVCVSVLWFVCQETWRDGAQYC